MKRLSALAFVTALVLTGCGGGGGSSSAAGVSNGSSDIQVKTDSQGFSTETKFVDENGNVVTHISDIRSDATGATPPTAPSVGGKSSAPAIN